MTPKHIHDCTGPDQTCPCGYKFTVPRFSFSCDVYDNDTKAERVNECFSAGDAGVIAATLRRIADRLERIR